MSSPVKNELGKEEIEALSYLSENNPGFLVSSGIFSPRGYAKYIVNSVSDFLRQNNKNRLVIMKKGRIQGAALLRFMEWDSNFFKKPVGNIQYLLAEKNLKDKETEKIQKYLLNTCGELARKSGMKILYISADSANHLLLKAINSSGFGFICGQIERLIKKGDLAYLAGEKEQNNKYEFRRYKKEDYRQISRIAEQIDEEIRSKFSLTPYLPIEKTKHYYAESIRNCCLGVNADEVFVARKYNRIIGFVCYKNDVIAAKYLRKKISFSVMGGILRSERNRNVGTGLLNWSYRQVFRNSEAVLGKVYLHNPAMVRFTLRRNFTPAVNFIYTFYKKL